MKYIKTYEKIIDGDYIVAKNNKTYKMTAEHYFVAGQTIYVCYLSNNKRNTLYGHEIQRYATPEEIEQYKIESETSKYNI